MAVVTDFASIAAAQAAGYTLTTYTAGTPSRFFARLEKYLNGDNFQSSTRLEVLGDSAVDSATAQANALASLNAVRRHRYAGSPGAPSGATVVSQLPRGKTPTVDVD
jgi:hypothetical protein